MICKKKKIKKLYWYVAFGARLGKAFYLGCARNFGFKVFVKTKFGSNISRIILLSGAPGTLWDALGPIILADQVAMTHQILVICCVEY